MKHIATCETFASENKFTRYEVCYWGGYYIVQIKECGVDSKNKLPFWELLSKDEVLSLLSIDQRDVGTVDIHLEIPELKGE